MKVLVQLGNKGDSVKDHLVRPLAMVNDVEKVILVSRHPGPELPKAEYRTPSRFFTRLALTATLCQSLDLIRISKSENPDCIVAHKLFPNALMAFFAAKMTKRPIIISIIAGPVEMYSIGSPIGVDFTRPLRFVGRMFLWMLKRADAVVTTGSYTKEFLVRHGVDERKIYPIIHTPSHSRYHPTDVQKEYDVIFVGRLAPVKRVDMLLQAIAKVKETRSNIRACIVGDGPLREDLVNLAVELGINDNVRFVGFQRDTTKFYNKSKLFVLTSEREGFPNVLLEAMMCGLAPIISDCGDVRDLAVDSHNSLVIPIHDDHDALAGAIERLLEDQDMRGELSQNALKTTMDLPIEEATRNWMRVLEAACARSQ